MSKDMLSSACAPRELSGPLATLFDRCSGQDGREWLQAFNRFLRKENPWRPSLRFQLWKSLQIGKLWIGKHALTIRDMVRNYQEESGCAYCGKGKECSHAIHHRAKTLLRRVTFHPVEMRICLTCVEVEELGITQDNVPYAEVCKAALTLGLQLCPIETGIQLAAQGGIQLSDAGHQVIIASNPIYSHAYKSDHLFTIGYHADGYGGSLGALMFQSGLRLKSRVAFVLPN